MTASHHAQKALSENRLGLHYSRFQPLPCPSVQLTSLFSTTCRRRKSSFPAYPQANPRRRASPVVGRDGGRSRCAFRLLADRRATALIEDELMVVSLTVVLEVECALRANYRLGRPAILSALRKFAALSTVAVEDPAILAHALDRAGHGLRRRVTSGGFVRMEAFASFDRRLARGGEGRGVAGADALGADGQDLCWLCFAD